MEGQRPQGFQASQAPGGYQMRPGLPLQVTGLGSRVLVEGMGQRVRAQALEAFGSVWRELDIPAR